MRQIKFAFINGVLRKFYVRSRRPFPSEVQRRASSLNALIRVHYAGCTHRLAPSTPRTEMLRPIRLARRAAPPTEIKSSRGFNPIPSSTAAKTKGRKCRVSAAAARQRFRSNILLTTIMISKSGLALGLPHTYLSRRSASPTKPSQFQSQRFTQLRLKFQHPLFGKFRAHLFDF